MREWLAEARAKAGLTMAETGKKIGVSESYYSLVENGLRQKKMDITMVTRLSSALGIPVEEIIQHETVAEDTEAIEDG